MMNLNQGVDLSALAAASPNKRPKRSRPQTLMQEPVLGPGVGQWTGRDLLHIQLPGGSLIQFDLSKLTIGDFRMMRDNYQLNASLAVLAFVLHQIDWGIECDDPSIAEDIEKNLRELWTQLVRAISQAFWAGYSPNVIEWSNDLDSGLLVIDKFKDMVPEECRVHWREVNGWKPPGSYAAPKIKLYDGFTQSSNPYFLTAESGVGVGSHFQSENTLWYPLFMENGDFYGKKLLRPAFAPWFFSTLMHLFSNRYYERFGEPTPVGRAPFDDTVSVNGTEVAGADVMRNALMNLRSRGVVVLPTDRDYQTKEYEYDIKYLESQMRGADFERYLSRLDEEMSLAIFTPILLFRTADVGSYNLGQQHIKVFLWMLNYLAGDVKLYIQKYVIDRMKSLNYGDKAPKAEWVYRKLGKDQEASIAQIVMEVIRSGRAMPNLTELGTALGVTMEEIEVLAPTPGSVPGEDTTPTITDPDTKDAPPTVVANRPNDLRHAHSVLDGAVRRAGQVYGKGNALPEFGYRKQLVAALQRGGCSRQGADRIASQVHTRMTDFIGAVVPLHKSPDEFGTVLDRAARLALEDAVA